MGKGIREENVSFEQFIYSIENVDQYDIDISKVETTFYDEDGRRIVITYTPYKSIDGVPNGNLKGKLEISVEGEPK